MLYTTGYAVHHQDRGLGDDARMGATALNRSMSPPASYGQTEARLRSGHSLRSDRSELMTVMTMRHGALSGGIMAAYIAFRH